MRPVEKPPPVVECVPNFSEGADHRVVTRIADVIAAQAGVSILGVTLDPDHHRSVITFAGAPEAVLEGAVAGVAKAVELIDLTRHTGVHPRLGAADVIPFVPVSGTSLDACARLAERAGEEIWHRLGVPVYLYEAAARTPERKQLERVRRGGFETLRTVALEDESRRPDIGGPGLHPTAGACIVGARKFLVAINVNLQTGDLEAANAIARKVRASSGGFPYVKALGFRLASRGQVQVSMNLTDFEQTPVHVVVAEVRRQAEALGVEVAGTEIIGLLPRAVIEAAASHYLQFENFRSDLVLENKLEELRSGGQDKMESSARIDCADANRA